MSAVGASPATALSAVSAAEPVKENVTCKVDVPFLSFCNILAILMDPTPAVLPNTGREQTLYKDIACRVRSCDHQ